MRQISDFKIAFAFAEPFPHTEPKIAILSDGGLTFSHPETVFMAVAICEDVTKEEKNMLKNYAEKMNVRNYFFVEEPILAAMGSGLVSSDQDSTLLVHFGKFNLHVCRFSYVDRDNSNNSFPNESCFRIEKNTVFPQIGFSSFLKNKYAINVDDQSLTMLAKLLNDNANNGSRDLNSLEITGTDLLQGLQMTVIVDLAELKNFTIKTSKDVFEKVFNEISEWSKPENKLGKIMITGDSKCFPNLLHRLNSELLPTTVSEFAIEAVDRGIGIFLRQKMSELINSL